MTSAASEPFPFVLIVFADDNCFKIARIERFPTEEIAARRAERITRDGGYWTSVWERSARYGTALELAEALEAAV